LPIKPATTAATMQRPRDTRHKRLTAMIALLSAIVAVAIVAIPAAAVDYTYATAVLGPYDHYDGDLHSLTASQAYDDFGSDGVCAAATDSSHNFYGSYACGNGFAEHCYSGQNLLYPRMHNSEAFSQQMHGREYYSATCP
jgi:hypothetical protein